jgi:hypothetical protein
MDGMLILIWLVCAGIAYAIGAAKGKGGLGLALGFFLGLLGVLIICLVPGVPTAPAVQLVQCPHCKSGIHPEANLCPFCRSVVR